MPQNVGSKMNSNLHPNNKLITYNQDSDNEEELHTEVFNPNKIFKLSGKQDKRNREKLGQGLDTYMAE